MRYRLILTAALLLPAAAHAGPLMPGMWERTAIINILNAPGMPPKVMEAMKQPHTMRDCMTAAEAARGPAEMLKQDKSCQATKLVMSGGVLDMQLTCHRPNETMTVSTHGSYTPVSYTGVSQMTTTGKRAMRMTVTASGKRIGACK